MQMQLARRGGHLGGNKIQPKDVDGHIQALRRQMIAIDVEPPRPPFWRKKKDKAGGAHKDPVFGSLVPHSEGASLGEVPSGLISNVPIAQSPILDGKDELPVSAPVIQNDQPVTGGDKRITIFATDTQDFQRDHRPKWAKHVKPWDTVYCAGDQPLDQTMMVPWPTGTLPGDLHHINLTPMEEGVRRSAFTNEEWKTDYVDEPLYSIGITTNDELAEHMVDSWWKSEDPAINTGLIPYVEEYMKSGATSDHIHLGEAYVEALKRLGQDGSVANCQMANAAQIMRMGRKPKVAGSARQQHLGWGGRYPCNDYTAQELSIGDLHFLCIDMGFEIPLGLHLRTASGEPDKIEKNQFVCAHLALGLEWAAQGFPRRVHTKSRVLILASQLRKAEYQQAQLFTEHCPWPTTRSNAKLFSLAHDVMTAHHDRSFQDIQFFWSGAEVGIASRAVHVFDVETHGEITRINVRQFGAGDSSNGGLDRVINLLVWRGHMRFMLPSTETRPTCWRDLSHQVGEIALHDWMPWNAFAHSDCGREGDIVLHPCRTCSKLCRYVPDTLLDPHPNVAGGQATSSHESSPDDLNTPLKDEAVIDPQTGQNVGEHIENDEISALFPPGTREIHLPPIPNGCVYELRPNEQYEPNPPVLGIPEAGKYSGSPTTEYRMRPAFELMRRRSMRRTVPDEEEGEERKRKVGWAGGSSDQLHLPQ